MKNPPAFPRAAFAPTNVGYEDVGIHDSQEGMDLRDWFAGQALVGLMANPTEHGVLEEFAKTAYKLADAMLAARETS